MTIDSWAREGAQVGHPDRTSVRRLDLRDRPHAAVLHLPRSEELRDERGPGSEPELPVRRDAVFRRMLALADLLAAAIGLLVLDALRGDSVASVQLAVIPAIVVLAKLTGRYDHDDVVLRKSTLDEVPRLLTLAAAFVLGLSLLALMGALPEREGDAVVLWASIGGALVILRSLARALAQFAAPTERVLIVGSSAARARIARRLAAEHSGRTEVVGTLPLEDERRATSSDWGQHSRRRRDLRIDDLRTVVRELEVQRVVVIPTSADPETMLDAISVAVAAGVKVSIVPRIFEVIGSSVEFDEVGGTTLLGVRRPGLSRSSRMIKRATDLAGAGICLLVLAPLGALVALAIKLDSSGPVFYRQPRVGRDGQTFWMIKFRSMIDGAHAQRAALESLNESEGLFKLAGDPRVTRVGALLRRTKLDELPQLLNVLRGEMSLVGPRPLVPEEDRRIEGRHRSRLHLLPGMTGPWQLLGPTRAPLSEMVKIDYLYQANWSLWYDGKILLRTAGHVLLRRGM